MKTQPSCTIYNGLHILKLIEIACKSHMILSTSGKRRNKTMKKQSRETRFTVFTWKLQKLLKKWEAEGIRSLLPTAD